jgi:hypothetical protein
MAIVYVFQYLNLSSGAGDLFGDSLVWPAFENNKSKSNLLATFFHGKNCVSIFAKSGFSFILGNRFANSKKFHN